MKINNIADLSDETKAGIISFLTGKVGEYKYQLLQEVIAKDGEGNDFIDIRPASEFMDMMDKIHIMEVMMGEIIGDQFADLFMNAITEDDSNGKIPPEEIWNEHLDR